MTESNSIGLVGLTWEHRPMELLTPEELELWRAWKTATETVRSRIADDVREASGLGDADFGVLSWVVDVGGGELHSPVLERALGLTRTQLRHRLDRMQGRGLINGVSGHDSVSVRATVDGREALNTARPAHAEAARRYLLQPLSGIDSATLVDLLARLASTP